MLAKPIAAIVAICAGVVLAMPGGAASAETLLQRGAYLTKSVAACGRCHTPRDGNSLPIAGMEMAGGTEFDDVDLGHVIAPNITPDPKTGIGRWTQAQIVNAIRNGKRPDGTIIGPPMPIEYYRNLSDSDARAIVAYLRTVKPIKNKTEPIAAKIQPRNSGGSSSPGFTVPCFAANMKIAPIVV